jgi:hypothetical protein
MENMQRKLTPMSMLIGKIYGREKMFSIAQLVDSRG